MNIKDKCEVAIKLATSDEEKEKFALRNEELASHINHCMSLKENIKDNLK